MNYRCIGTLDAPYSLYGVDINPKNSNIVIYGDSSRVTIVDTSLKVIDELISINGEILSISISEDGKYLASIGDRGYLEVWSLGDYRRLYSIDLEMDCNVVAIDSDGRLLAVGGDGGLIEIYNLISGERLARFRAEDDILAIDFIESGRVVISASRSNRIRLWSLRGDREMLSYVATRNGYGEIDGLKSFNNCTILALTEIFRADGGSRLRAGSPIWRYSIKFRDHRRGRVIHIQWT